jgi:hypothetical protein
MQATINLPPDERPHRVLCYLTIEIQEILPTGENQGSPKTARKDTISFEGESLSHAEQRMNEFISLAKHFL